MSVTGTAQVASGGRNGGGVTATLAFANGKLTRVQEIRNVRPGVRPVCQATKLLDADPLVRRMAEQDLLVMGIGCGAYVWEQRERAAPPLREAIDAVWWRIVAEEGLR